MLGGEPLRDRLRGVVHRPRTRRSAASTWRNSSKLRCPADSPKALRGHRTRLFGQHPGWAAVDGHLRTERGRSGRGGRRRDRPGREGQQVGLDDDGTAGASLLMAPGAAGRAQAVDLTTHAASPCPGGPERSRHGRCHRLPAQRPRRAACPAPLSWRHRSRPLERLWRQRCRLASGQPTLGARLRRGGR